MKLPAILFLLLAINISSVCFSQQVSDTTSKEENVFEKVEVEASYPGGAEAWLQFLEKNANAGVATENGAPIGRYTVLVQFVVATDGKLSAFKPLTKMGYGMEQEVLRILRASGTWTPAMQNGRAVKAFRKQPVTFQVEDDAITVTTKTPYVLFTTMENIVTITVKKVKPEDLRLTITQGTVYVNGDGEFLVKVSKPGRVIIRVYGKKEKELGVISFEVREK